MVNCDKNSELRDFLLLESVEIYKSTNEWIQSEESRDFLNLAQGIINLFEARKNKVVFLGNGGSAAESSHLAAEFISKCVRDTGAKAAVSLVDNLAVMTAVANDFGYENVFSRQVEALCTPGDIVIGLSTSGTSTNVVKALKCARSLGCTTSLWTSKRYKGQSELSVDWLIVAPTLSTPRAQEFHLFLGHTLSEFIESHSEIR